MTMHRYFSTLALALTCIFSYAQNEGNNWYFGFNGGLTFNTNPPSELTDGQLSTSEGCTAISDDEGVLLFYSDGISIWNSNHDIMTNGTGLLGNSSSTQSGVIVKKPGDNTIYYLFAVTNEGNPAGLTYSEVDMSLEGGLGAVTENKNIEIIAPTCEKIVAVTHANGTDFWIVTHLYNSSDYHSYLLSEDGLSDTPVVTTIGLDVGFSSTNTIGYLKSSLDGSLIVSAAWTLDVVELFHFNNSTGVLSDLITIDNLSSPYGVEFSPNGNLLYVSEISADIGVSNLYQYNISTYNEQIIEDSQLILDNSSSGYGALQIAPDLKIYLSIFGSFLSAINEPNTLGTNCDYNTEAVSLSPGSVILGLPTFYNSAFTSNSVSFLNTCIGDLTEFGLANNELDSVLWNFDDPGSGINNTSDLISPSHVFSSVGEFDVSVISYFEEVADTVVNTITIFDLPEIDLGPPLNDCAGETITISPSETYDTYLWEDDSSLPFLTVSENGTYSLIVSENGCYNSDSVEVTFTPYPEINLGPDTLICEGVPLILNASVNGASYEWSNDSNNSTLAVSTEGIYSVVVNLNDCISSDEIIVTSYDCITVLIMPNVFSPNGDQLNSNFKPIQAQNVIAPRFKIFNRWGILVFESANLNHGWNGRFNTNECSDGSYFWIVEYRDIEGNEVQKNGTLTLLR